jgi:hypothetical protein
MSSINYKNFTLGIEEEYMVVDPESKENDFRHCR